MKPLYTQIDLKEFIKELERRRAVLSLSTALDQDDVKRIDENIADTIAICQSRIADQTIVNDPTTL